MKSFRLASTSRREVIESVIALLIGVGIFFALDYFHITEAVWRVFALLSGAIFVGYLCRGYVCRSLRGKYPNARWIGVLAVGFAITTFGVIARFVVPGAEEGQSILAFIVPSAVCVAAFLIVNR